MSIKQYSAYALLFMLCICASIFVGSVFATALFIITDFIPFPGITRVLNELILTALTCLFIFIAMHRIGYKGNIANEKKPVKEFLILVIISVGLFTAINALLSFRFSSPLAVTLSAYLANHESWGVGIEAYLLENHYFLFPLAAAIQSVLYTIFMILGFNVGYKKREADRTKMIEARQDQN
jgi:hypothetical protein